MRSNPGQWALTPYLYAVNGRRDLMANISRDIAEGILALSDRELYARDADLRGR